MLVKAEKCGKVWLWLGVESYHGDAEPRLDEEGKGKWERDAIELAG